MFGETDRQQVTLDKIYSLQQGNRVASSYASEFRQLACELEWGDHTLRDQFRRGLRSDVKNLLISISKQTSLSEAITQAVRCDNRLFEFHQEERLSRVGLASFLPSARPKEVAYRETDGPSCSKINYAVGLHQSGG
jgi:hypothetical protein